MIRTKQIEQITNDALAPDVKIGSLGALPVAIDNSSVTSALLSLYNSLKTTFLALDDTPAGYTGNAHRFTKVAQAENALQFSSMRENTVGNIGINFSGAMSSLDYRLLVDDSSPSNFGGMYLNKNFGYAALQITAGGGAHALSITTDGATSDLLQCSGQYSGILTAKHNGHIGIGTSAPANRLHVAWRSGDSVATTYFGSSTTGNNQSAIDAESLSAVTIRANSITGSYAVQGITSATGSFGLNGFSPNGGGIRATGALYGGWFESTGGTGLYVHTGSVRLAPLGGSGTRMVTADTTGTLGVQSIPAGGILSLGGLTVSTQTFANDTNVTVTSSGSTHTLGWMGQLPISRGGTGAATAIAALNNLLPTQAGHTGKFLSTDGSAVSWTTVPATGITSLGGLTGAIQTFANDTNVTMSSSGSTHTLGWAGTLPISRGGTGATTTTGALTNLLPSQSGNNGKTLITDGTTISWQPFPAPGITSLGGLTAETQTFANDTNVTVTSSGNTHTLGWTGQLAISRGGTGAATAPAALNNLLPAQTGHTGKFLTTDGSAVSWAAVPATGITSLGGLTGTTQTFANDTNVTISSSGSTHSLSWSGQLAISRGGTGAATATTALNNLLPSQSGHSGKTLVTNGTAVAWQTFPATGLTSLGGLTTEAQTFANDTNVTISSSGSTHTLGWVGTLPISRGGTGAATATTALNNLLPSQSGQSGKFLATDGSAVSWAMIPAAGITSLGGLTAGTQTFANDTNITITSSGSTHTLGWVGELPITRGGTGATTANTALNNLLPSQSGQSGKALVTNGTTVAWQAFPATGITSLGGLTGAAQTFANDTNVTVTSSGSTHTLGWAGQLPITRGGTGANTATTALNNLLPSQSGHSGKALVTNGTTVAWQAFPATGLTSLGGLTSATQTFANDTNVTLSSSGSTHSLGWTGQLPITRGGTGAATANTALNNLLPAQATYAGKYLYSDGTNSSWKSFPTPSQTRFVSAGFLGLAAPYYTTIQAAIDDATSGDLVEVFAGIYLEYLTLKNGVNVCLHTGVIVRYSGNTYHTVTANNTDCIIDGFGSIEHDAATNLSVVAVTGSSNLTLRCLRLNCEDGQSAIVVDTTGHVTIHADEIVGTGPTIIEVTAGTVEITARRIEQVDPPSSLLYQAGGTVRITNSLLKGSYPTPTGTGGLLNKSGGTLMLSGCTIVNDTTASPAYSIGASTAQAVKIYHCVTNKAAHANISFPVQALVVDADVS